MSLELERELAQLIEEMCALKARAGKIAQEFGCDQQRFTDYLADMLIYEFALMKSLAKTKQAEALNRLIS